MLILTLLGSLFTAYAENYNEVDAVSNATEDIKVTGGKAYADRAVLTTYHKDSYDNHWLGYGKTEALTDTVKMPDFPWDNEVTLTPLEANTKYFFTFMGALINKPEENHYCSGSFITATITPIVHPHKSITSKKDMYQKGDLLLSNSFEIGDVIFIRDIKGRIVQTYLLHSGHGTSVELSSLPVGAFTAEQVRAGERVSVTKIFKQ